MKPTTVVAMLTLLACCGPAFSGPALAQESDQPAVRAMKAKDGSTILVRQGLRGTAPTVDVLMENVEAPLAYGAEKEVLNRVPDSLKGREPVETIADPLAQSLSSSRAPVAGLSFGGYDSDDNANQFGFRIMPPDTEGDVGLTYYVQYNNLGWKYFLKSTGALAGGPFPGNIFWQGFGGVCETDNAGDPIVLYDQFADQWVFSQFTDPGNPDGHQCFAVTQGNNPAGPYFLYDFVVSPGQFNDYEKISVWTDTGGGQSAYHMTSNEFAGSFVGVHANAFERDAMLAGNPASFIQFDLGSVVGGKQNFSLQPSHLEGGNTPPAGTCNKYIQAFDNETWGTGPGPDGYRFWTFCVDFNTPSNSTMSETGFANAVAFDAELCGYSRDCIPQPGTTQRLDTLGQFTMYRFANRYFPGTGLRGAISHSVDSGGDVAGVRWAEIDVDNEAVLDSGTLAPGDGVSRWMPSTSIDGAGNIGIVFTKSSSSVSPSVYFTGREAGDPPGTLQAEVVCIDGTGSQLGGNRWGDYASVSVDPADDCTFWVTNEYVETTGSFQWDTQICSFSFASCGAGCTQNSDCDDNDVCNGVETCDIPSGTCQAGTPLTCDDGVFCNGAETCDPVLGCQAGTPPTCDDGVGCTIDSCNAGTDMCENLPDHASCDDLLFCTGVETCDPVLDCQSSGNPCLPGESCNEGTNMCDPGAPAQLESACLSVGGSAVTVNLTNTYTSAVVTTSVQYSNNTTPVVPRVSAVTSTSFDVRLQNPSGGGVAADNLCYLVVEEGTWTIDGVSVEAQKYTSTVTDENNSWVGEAQSYGQSYTEPVVLGQVMSSVDANFSVFWDQGTSRTNPPIASTLVTGKTVCEDTNTARADETVGFIVIEAGHGTIGGVEYEAGLGADTVLGVDDAPPYTYTFNTAFAGAPTVAVTTMAAVDGGNGGWAQVHGSTLATTTSLFLSIDEDQIGDAERNHTTEQVAYVAFAGPVVFPDVGCTSNPQCDDGDVCNGAETCDIPSGICQSGTPLVCDDGDACNGAETCDPGLGCQAGTPLVCDDGDVCNGTETCDPGLGCQAGTPLVCDDGVFCNGAETCDPGLGCQAGTPPTCDDGVGCTIDSCNAGTDTCENLPDHASCDDLLFCTGVETCDPLLDCQSSGNPCLPGETCNEGTNMCDPGATTVMEWGSVSAGSSPVTVNLTGTYTSPVIVTAINYDNNTIPVVTRISSVTGSSFAVNLQNAGAGAVATDTVSYLVVEEGVHTVNGVLIEAQTYNSTVTDENNSWVGQAQALVGSFTSPVVLGQVMSSNAADWSVFWDQGTSRNSPPTASALTTGKTVCEDTFTARANETVGFVVIEAGHGTLGGVEFEAALGADTVRGVTNAPPYTYTFSTPFATAPAVAVVTMAAVDGNNGGWAYTFGASPTSTTSLDLVIDEDTIGDSERNHTTEQVGYVAFATAGDAQ